MPDALSATVTRPNPVTRKLLDALDPKTLARVLIRPTQKAATAVAQNKLSGQVLGAVTGNLKRSLLPSVRTQGAIASFGTSLEYGAIWENGLGKRAARPWLQPGTEEFVGSGEFVRILAEEIRRIVQ